MSTTFTGPGPTGFASIPHRKVIRTWMAAIGAPSTARALALVAVDLLLLGLTTAATIVVANAALKIVAACAMGLVISRLFILGHDACHQSLTRHRTLNRWLGRLLFLPSLTPYSLWEVGHNVVHHGYTNLRGFDFVWQPLSLSEFRALPRHRQWLERVDRSGWAPWLYYAVEIWWKRMFFPNRATMPTRRPVFLRDSLLVAAFALLWIGGLAVAAVATRVGFAAAPELDPKDPQAAALGYVVDATKADKAKYPKYAAGQLCGNCQLYQGKAGDASGACPLFAGRAVQAKGWCSAYAKKA